MVEPNGAQGAANENLSPHQKKKKLCLAALQSHQVEIFNFDVFSTKISNFSDPLLLAYFPFSRVVSAAFFLRQKIAAKAQPKIRSSAQQLDTK
jgi:hypothetical protein